MNERLGFCCLLYRCYVVELVVSSCSRKKFRSSHEKCSSKKLFFKILQILHCVGVTLFKITLELKLRRSYFVPNWKYSSMAFVQNCSEKLSRACVWKSALCRLSFKGSALRESSFPFPLFKGG